jgi:hypothetical protein
LKIDGVKISLNLIFSLILTPSIFRYLFIFFEKFSKDNNLVCRIFDSPMTWNWFTRPKENEKDSLKRCPTWRKCFEGDFIEMLVNRWRWNELTVVWFWVTFRRHFNYEKCIFSQNFWCRVNVKDRRCQFIMLREQFFQNRFSILGYFQVRAWITCMKNDIRSEENALNSIIHHKTS